MGHLLTTKGDIGIDYSKMFIEMIQYAIKTIAKSSHKSNVCETIIC